MKVWLTNQSCLPETFDTGHVAGCLEAELEQQRAENSQGFEIWLLVCTGVHWEQLFWSRLVLSSDNSRVIFSPNIHFIWLVSAALGSAIKNVEGELVHVEHFYSVWWHYLMSVVIYKSFCVHLYAVVNGLKLWYTKLAAKRFLVWIPVLTGAFLCGVCMLATSA